MPYQLVWRGYCRRTGSCRAPRWEKASWRRRWRERALRRRSRAGGSLRVDCRFVSSYRDSNHWLACEARARIASADGSPADSVAVPVQSSSCLLTRVIASPTGQRPGRRRLNPRAAGVTDDVLPHGLRHTASTYLADAVAGNTKLFKRIAGWSNREVSDRYVGVPRSALIEATKRFQAEVASKVT